MENNQFIGELKKFDTQSKVDGNQIIHTVTMKIKLIDNKGVENIRDVANALNKPIRVNVEKVQLEANL